LLRPPEPGDLDDFAALYADPKVMRFWPRPYTREEARERLERMIADHQQRGFGLWATLRKSDGRFIGRCGLLRQTVDGNLELEVAYMLAASVWGQGLAPEAAHAILRFAFEQIAPPRVIALIRPENLPSRRVAEKLGLRRVGEHLHANLLHDVFAVTREEWQPHEQNSKVT
jgi:ribosomal-protein-alanine N-acetyltransferase